MEGHGSKSPDELKISFSKAEVLNIPLVCVSLQDPRCSDAFSHGAGSGRIAPSAAVLGGLLLLFNSRIPLFSTH